MTEHLLKTRSEMSNDNLIAILCHLLGHSDADVRKTVVFCLVEVVVSGQTNAQNLESKFKLNPSQVKLV